MIVLIALLTTALVLDCIILILLVLIQLPKKEAGAGLAFGAGATDALFGAGSGTVLTKITKYAAGIFFALCIILSLLQRSHHSQGSSEFQKGAQTGITPPPRSTPAPAPASTNVSTTNAPGTDSSGTNTLLRVVPAEASNAPAASTNAPGTPK